MVLVVGELVLAACTGHGFVCSNKMAEQQQQQTSVS
jgi:hypothetical protein